MTCDNRYHHTSPLVTRWPLTWTASTLQDSEMSRRLRVGPVLVAVATGVASGLYIFGPYFQTQTDKVKTPTTSNHGNSDSSVHPDPKQLQTPPETDKTRPSSE